MLPFRSLLCCLALACLLPPGCQSPPPASPPNIVYILADDLGYAELGSFGQPHIATPHLDQLAREGMRFTQHYAGAPVCAPSRCVLLTGQHSGHAYLRSNDEWKERGEVWDYAKAIADPRLEGQRPLKAGISTLGDMLQQAGYRTAMVGKWGLGAPLSEAIPTRRGFDFFFGYNCQRQAHNLYPNHLWRNEEKVRLNNELVVPGTKLDDGADPLDPASYARYEQTDYAPALMLDEALGFLDHHQARHPEQPFFLYFASPLPHVPLQVPASYLEPYKQAFGEEEPYLGEQGYFPHPHPRAAYAAMVTYLDEQVGQLVARLKEMGAYDNTLIIFSSDNGPSYAGGTDSPFFDSAHPFKSEYGWAKGFVHEGGIRVPMIASWPGTIQAGSESNHLSAFWDVMPTLGAVAGSDHIPPNDGISFLPTLLGDTARQEAHRYLYWEFPSYTGQQAVRMGPWKGIRKNLLDGQMELELYHLPSDPREQQNVAQQHPEIVQQIEAFMQEAHSPAEIERFRMKVLGD